MCQQFQHLGTQNLCAAYMLSSVPFQNAGQTAGVVLRVSQFSVFVVKLDAQVFLRVG
jgi:hypothetical protein